VLLVPSTNLIPLCAGYSAQSLSRVERIRVASFIDAAANRCADGVPRRGPIPAGMHTGAARLQSNRLPSDEGSGPPP